jgi:hypothetical protein
MAEPGTQLLAAGPEPLLNANDQISNASDNSLNNAGSHAQRLAYFQHAHSSDLSLHW